MTKRIKKKLMKYLTNPQWAKSLCQMAVLIQNCYDCFFSAGNALKEIEEGISFGEHNLASQNRNSAFFSKDIYFCGILKLLFDCQAIFSRL